MLLQWFSSRFPRPSNAAALRPSGRRRAAAALSLGFAVAGFVASASAQADIPAAERQVLVDLYASAGGANWSNKTNWLGAAGTECTWNGVTCDAGKTHVAMLKLNFNNLIGTLPASLSALSELTLLNLRQNDLDGAIPELAGLTKLVNLDLSDNKFTGTLPSLTGMSELVDFRVQGGGQITGSTPDLTGLSKLKFFYVNGNKLDGQIGPIAGATALEEFNVYNNNLTGPIPDLTGLVALKSFNASVNKLTSITALAGLANLDTFIVSQNQLSGQIPSLQGLGKLRSFYVDYNQLSGPIPPLTDLVNIQQFYARENQLTGQIPSLAGLTKMTAFWVYKNQLVGSPPMPPNQTMAAVLCPNPLRNSTDAAINLAWDNVVTGNNPWSDGCTGSWDVTPTVRDASSGDPIIDGSTGTISPSTTQILPQGGTVQFVLTPAPGYHLRTPIDSSCPGDRNGNVFTAGPVTDNCYVNAVFVSDEATPVDGVCGSDHGKTLSAPPTNLCSVGTASAVAGSGPWTWSCAGEGGGVTAQCSAQKAGQTWTVTATVEGGGGTASPATQSVADGSHATISATPDSGYALATAEGCGATISGNTVTTAAVTADCAVTLTFGPAAHATTTQFISVIPAAPRVGDGVSVRVRVSDAALAGAVGALSGAATTAHDARPAAIPTGAVTVSGGGTSCVAALDVTGNGQCSLSFITAGVHQLTAAYPGNAGQGHLPSSAVYAVTVTGTQAPSSLARAPLLDRAGLLLLGLLLCGGVLWRRTHR